MNRTKEEKKLEAKKIISKLTELKLTVIYEPVRELFELLKKYIEEEKNVKINIDFYEIKKKFVGNLPIKRTEECWVKLTNI